MLQLFNPCRISLYINVRIYLLYPLLAKHFSYIMLFIYQKYCIIRCCYTKLHNGFAMMNVYRQKCLFRQTIKVSRAPAYSEPCDVRQNKFCANFIGAKFASGLFKLLLVSLALYTYKDMPMLSASYNTKSLYLRKHSCSFLLLSIHHLLITWFTCIL